MILSDIVFWTSLAFLFGVGGAEAQYSYLTVSLAALFVCGFFALQKSQWKLCLFFFPVVLGFLYVFIYAQATTPTFDGVTKIVGLVEDVALDDTSQRVILSVREPVEGTVQAILPLEPRFAYGDLVRITGSIAPGRNAGSNPRIAARYVELLKTHQGFWLKDFLVRLRERSTAYLDLLLPPSSAHLIAGFLFGSHAAQFDAVFKTQMAASGTTHLVALSGYNIAILIFAVSAMLTPYVSRRGSFLGTVCIIVFFVLMVGAEASIVRAACMGFLLLTAIYFGRAYSVRNAITLTAFLMIIINPFLLFYDVGFELSFVSLLGIVYLSPVLHRLFGFERSADAGVFGWKEVIVATLSAQLAVLPLLLYYFNQASLIALLTNVLILPFVPLTMFFGFVLILISLLSLYVSFVLAQVLSLLLSYELAVIRLGAQFQIPVPLPLGVIAFSCYYLVLLYLAYSYAETR